VHESRIEDLPVRHRGLEVIWRKRRYRCAERPDLDSETIVVVQSAETMSSTWSMMTTFRGPSTLMISAT
jgi:hypothetical protein